MSSDNCGTNIEYTGWCLSVPEHQHAKYPDNTIPMLYIDVYFSLKPVNTTYNGIIDLMAE